MATKQLTEKFCERVKSPESGRAEYWDVYIRGLGLRVSEKGRKSWTLLYRQHGKKRRLGLGTYPAVDLKAARKAAGKALQSVERGEDPAMEKKARRKPAPDTVEAAFEEFDKRHLSTLREGAKARRTLEKTLVKEYGSARLDTLKRHHILPLIDDIVDRGAPIEANRTLAWIKRFLNWCATRGMIEYNPAQGVARPAKELPRQRVLSDKELQAVWSAAQVQEGIFGVIVRVLLITAQRRGEVAEMRWEDVDLEQGVWTLKPQQTKSETVHEVPLSSLAVELLKDIPRMHGNPYVFAGRGRGRFNAFGKGKERLDALLVKRAEDEQAVSVEDWRLHDLRRTAATGLARLGFSNDVIGAVLNHAPAGVTQRHYQQFRDFGAKKAALEAWANHLQNIGRGEQKVVPLHRELHQNEL